MAQIVNILLLIIVFVFDPLAISLVIAANRSFEIAFSKPSSNNNVTVTTSNKNVIEPDSDVITEEQREMEADTNDLPKIEKESEEVNDQKENEKPAPKKPRRSGGYWF